MKKLVILGAVVLAAVGVAFASSVTVPFFLDDAPGNNNWPITGGTATFIGIHNNTALDIVCEVSYRDDTGADISPASKSFTLEANSSLSFRPVADDPDVEGVDAAAVPNVNPASGKQAGSAVISWTGGPKDVQGRMVQITASGATDSSAYTLPEGE